MRAVRAATVVSVGQDGAGDRAGSPWQLEAGNSGVSLPERPDWPSGFVLHIHICAGRRDHVVEYGLVNLGRSNHRIDRVVAAPGDQDPSLPQMGPHVQPQFGQSEWKPEPGSDLAKVIAPVDVVRHEAIAAIIRIVFQLDRNIIPVSRQVQHERPSLVDAFQYEVAPDLEAWVAVDIRRASTGTGAWIDQSYRDGETSAGRRAD